ncbi:hypothetical protein AVEN_129913-1 [Araneus ventricosus]|uniref:Uncharacterized protein n=1 Tax=Araneus ventricosus TaxID=182803 RepID=A0A4Y2JRM9_ARAVE|nr:hypothetical protein AVEN_129913-1 [Araneus ventricosus]
MSTVQCDASFHKKRCEHGICPHWCAMQHYTRRVMICTTLSSSCRGNLSHSSVSGRAPCLSNRCSSRNACRNKGMRRRSVSARTPCLSNRCSSRNACRNRGMGRRSISAQMSSIRQLNLSRKTFI